MLRLELSVNQSARKSEIFLGRGLLDDLGQHLSRAFTKPPKRVGIISNKRVFNLYGRGVARSLKRAGFQPFTWLMPEGERYKAFPILEKAVKFLNENRFERNDLVVALGGRGVGELAGFGAEVDIYDPWADAREARQEYGVELLAGEPRQGGYDAIVVAVAHKQFKEVGAAGVRKYGARSSVIYDIKGLFGSTDVDARL